jgi:5-methylcytosine-specific restriction enzyme A
MLGTVVKAAKLAHAVIREHIIKAVGRSSHWPKVRRDFISSNPVCSACGSNTLLQVHHILPFHDDPSKELDTDNLIALCMSLKTLCHLRIGHGGSFTSFSQTVSLDAVEVRTFPDKFEEVARRAEENRIPNKPCEKQKIQPYL